MPVHSGDTGVEIIFRDECLRLLATEEVGRVAFVNGGQADVLPVNYALDGDTVVFTTAPGSKLVAAGRGPVTFEVDRVDPATRSGWSVVVRGFAQEVTGLDGPGHLERLQSLPLHPWAGGIRRHLVRITSRDVTGRRVGPTMPVAAPAAPAAVALNVLDVEACIRLLRTHRLGRLAFAYRGWPVVLPVNYAYEEPNVVIRTGPGTKLQSTPLRAVAFEIDDADSDGAWGWSVLVQGPAFDITDESDACSQRLRLAPVRPWAPGDRPHWLKVSALRVSGRSFGALP